MHELMDVNLQDKLGFTCDIPEQNNNDVENQDLLTEIVVDKNDCVMYAFVYGDINDVDTLISRSLNACISCILSKLTSYSYNMPFSSFSTACCIK